MSRKLHPILLCNGAGEYHINTLLNDKWGTPIQAKRFRCTHSTAGMCVTNWHFNAGVYNLHELQNHLCAGALGTDAKAMRAVSKGNDSLVALGELLSLKE